MYICSIMYYTMGTKVGIDNIGFYIPKLRVTISKTMEVLFRNKPEVLERMYNAVKTTGQQFMRITQKWQDSVCLAAESVFDVIDEITIDTLRFIVSATETSVDASKPIAAYLLGILKRAGVQLPKNISTFQTQHACAGGTISLLQCISMILASRQESSALVSMTDIARYEKDSTAEVTQGAGAVSLFISKNPRLMELQVDAVGLYSEDTDDFFRPTNSLFAKVRGRYSMLCYLNSVYSAVCDYAKNNSMTVEEVFKTHDYFAFHLPFANMSVIALRHILKSKLKWNSERIEKFLVAKYIRQSAESIASIGNTYTASTYFSLGYILYQQYQLIKGDIIGKKILILSYGSGNTSIVMAGSVSKEAPSVIKKWSLIKQIEESLEVDEKIYREWLSFDLVKPPDDTEKKQLSANEVYLEQLREDGYRVYMQVP